MTIEKTAGTIQDWMVAYLAMLLATESSKIDIDIPVERYGLDSAAAIELVSELADWLKIDLEPTIVFDHRTIRGLAEHIVAQEDPTS
jgi:acyl carrier protein